MTTTNNNTGTSGEDDFSPDVECLKCGFIGYDDDLNVEHPAGEPFNSENLARVCPVCHTDCYLLDLGTPNSFEPTILGLPIENPDHTVGPGATLSDLIGDDAKD